MRRHIDSIRHITLQRDGCFRRMGGAYLFFFFFSLVYICGFVASRVSRWLHTWIGPGFRVLKAILVFSSLFLTGFSKVHNKHAMHHWPFRFSSARSVPSRPSVPSSLRPAGLST